MSVHSWYLLFWSKLIDHPINFPNGRPGCLRSEEFKSIDIFRFVRLFRGLDYHPAFHPHLNPVSNRQVGALGNETRSELGVSSA